MKKYFAKKIQNWVMWAKRVLKKNEKSRYAAALAPERPKVKIKARTKFSATIVSSGDEVELNALRVLNLSRNMKKYVAKKIQNWVMWAKRVLKKNEKSRYAAALAPERPKVKIKARTKFSATIVSSGDEVELNAFNPIDDTFTVSNPPKGIFNKRVPAHVFENYETIIKNLKSQVKRNGTDK